MTERPGSNELAAAAGDTAVPFNFSDMHNVSRVSMERLQDNSPKQSNDSLLEQFKDSFVYSAVQSPLNGATQLVDSVAGTDLKSKVQWFDAPMPAEFGTLDWHVQQLGSAGGLAADFLLLNGAMRMGGAHLARTSLVARSPVLQQSLNAFATRPILNATISGGLYEGLFRETDPNGNWIVDRFKHAGIGGATFGALTATSIGLQNAGRAGLLGHGIIQRAVGNRAVGTALAGIPAGLLNAELSTGFTASGEELYQSAYGFAFVGGAMGGAHALAGRLKPSAETVKTEGTVESKALSEQAALDRGSPAPSMASAAERVHNFPLASSSRTFNPVDWLRELRQRGEVRQVEGVPGFGSNQEGITLFLDGGGVNGWRHVGVYKAARELGVPIKDVYAVSIGAPIGALIARGYAPEQIESILLREFNSPLVRETLPQQPGWRAFLSRKDPRPMIEHWVREYDAEPHPNLHIGAFRPWKRALHWFEGGPGSYNLVDAVKHSMGIPGVFGKLRSSGDHLGLVGTGQKYTMWDGGVRHITAADLPSNQPLVISRLHGTGPESASKGVMSGRFLHLLDGLSSRLLRRNSHAPDGGDVVIYPDKIELNALAFRQPDQVYKALVQDGYEQALKAFRPAIEAGTIPVVKDGKKPLEFNPAGGDALYPGPWWRHPLAFLKDKLTPRESY